jgi:hypothetical protein
MGHGAMKALRRPVRFKEVAAVDYILFFAIILGIAMSLLYAHGALSARRSGRVDKRQTHSD